MARISIEKEGRIALPQGYSRRHDLEEGTELVFEPIEDRLALRFAWPNTHRGAGAGHDAGLAVGVRQAKCHCGEILWGLPPHPRPLFDRVGTPEYAVGRCIASSEGAHIAHYAYGGVPANGR